MISTKLARVGALVRLLFRLATACGCSCDVFMDIMLIDSFAGSQVPCCMSPPTIHLTPYQLGGCGLGIYDH